MSRTLSLAAAALLALGLAACGEDIATMPADEPTAPSASADVQPPAGFRFVGIGHAAIAVPEAWGRNKIRCGATPEEDTYVIDVTTFAACASSRGKNLESVQVYPGDPRFDFEPDRTLAIDGVEAKRMDTTCTTETMGNVETCSGSIYIPAERVQFIAESSTNAAEVDAILERIRILPNQLGVLGLASFQMDDQERSGERYVAALEEAGFRTEVRTKLERGMPTGFVRFADPAPGTMARPGDLVVVTMTGGSSGPADEINVGMNWHDDKGTYSESGLDDQAIRDGATVTLHIGDRIWAYGKSSNDAELAGDFTGTALRPSTWDKDPNKGRSWEAVEAGTSTVTLYISVDGKRYDIGTVTVVVKPGQ